MRIQKYQQLKDPSKETDSVLDYPDSYLVESGNRHLSNEEDFKNLTITTNSIEDQSIRVSLNATKKSSSIEDPWNSPDLSHAAENNWKDRTSKDKWTFVLLLIVKVVGVLILLYFFVCSLDIMSVSLRLLAGKTAGSLVRDSPIIENPIAGLIMGLLFTVIVQSSSTATSVIVSMVAAGLFSVRVAIPFVMGANIGTSVTSSIVAFTQVKDRPQFQRAFAGATIHDMFNYLTALVLIIIEVFTHYLEVVTGLIVGDSSSNNSTGTVKVEFLGKITKPLTHLVISVDNNIEHCWLDPNCTTNKTSMLSRTRPHMFRYASLKDTEVGAILLVLCILIISVCLILVVKLLSNVLKGQIGRVVKKIINTKIPYCPCATGYVAILVGTGMTFLLQSSSVFTSALTPLVGLGILNLEIMYPLTLGANVGTTGTAILAAFAVDSNSEIKFKASLQIALCHLFFNLTGILIFYPLPFMRWPIYLAKKLGKSSAKYRWVALLYILVMFFILPGVLLGISFINYVAALTVLLVLVFFIAMILLINFLQERHPKMLPRKLQTWKWLPLPLRSFRPYDNMLQKLKCCRTLASKRKVNNDLSRKTSEVTLISKSMTAEPKPSNISLVSFSMDGEFKGDQPKRVRMNKT